MNQTRFIYHNCQIYHWVQDLQDLEEPVGYKNNGKEYQIMYDPRKLYIGSTIKNGTLPYEIRYYSDLKYIKCLRKN